MPCENLDRLDRRYRKRYGMSMVENLKELEEKGMEKFLKNQEEIYARARNVQNVAMLSLVTMENAMHVDTRSPVDLRVLFF